MTFDKKAIHFGGGNIGRGLIAECFHQSGFEVVFVDVQDDLISKLQKTSKYTVTEIGSDGERSFDIDHYRAINSRQDEAAVVDELATADTITCAVGPNILRFIAPVIAKGISARKKETPVAVIACENAIMATDTLKGFIVDKLDAATKTNLDKKARFANCAVDRIVPHQDPNAGLNVRIEKFHEWCVETKPFSGMQRPDIKGVHYVDDLTPYIERKLFTVNTSHATAAYLGYQLGKKTIHEAMADKKILDAVKSCLRETANLVTKKHGISQKEQDEYVNTIIDRISNPALEDKVERVGRAPLRKLSRKERFIGPAAELAEKGESVDGLLNAVETALRFQNVEGDEESVELAKILKSESAADATAKITGLDRQHPLFKRVEERVEKVQKAHKA